MTNPTPSNNELDKFLDEYYSDRKTASTDNGTGTRTTAHRKAVRAIENWANNKVIEGRVEQVMQDEQSFALEFSPPVDESKIIEWRTQTTEALRKKGDV